jgi:hypothetical protein
MQSASPPNLRRAASVIIGNTAVPPTTELRHATSSEQPAQVQKIEEVALDLEATRQPCPGEAAGIVGNRQDVVAFGSEANLCGRRSVADFLDGISPVRAESGEVGNAKVRDITAERSVDQFRFTDARVHLGEAAR